MTDQHDDQPESEAVQADSRDPVARVSTREKRFEVVATLILAFAALSTAWAGYQASLWDGLQSSDYTQASALRTDAAQMRTEANQYRLADLSVFESYIDASASGDETLARFYRDRFRDELDVAYRAWIELDPLDDPNAPASPLAMPEYRLTAEEDATRLEAQADRLFIEGEDANTYSDTYTLATLLLAVVLFFAAISERFVYVPMRMVLLTFAAVGLVAGVMVAAGQPITSG